MDRNCLVDTSPCFFATLANLAVSERALQASQSWAGCGAERAGQRLSRVSLCSILSVCIWYSDVNDHEVKCIVISEVRSDPRPTRAQHPRPSGPIWLQQEPNDGVGSTTTGNTRLRDNRTQGYLNYLRTCWWLDGVNNSRGKVHRVRETFIRWCNRNPNGHDVAVQGV